MGASRVGHVVDLGCTADFDICALAPLCCLPPASHAGGRTGPPRSLQRAVWHFCVSGPAAGIWLDPLVDNATSTTRCKTQIGLEPGYYDVERIVFFLAGNAEP